MRTYRILTGLMALALATCLAPVTAQAQSVAGSWAYQTPSGPLVLTFQVNGVNVTGTLAGNGNTFTLKGRTQEGEAYGTVEGGGGTAIFTAAIEGQALVFSMTENGANGQPNPATAREITFTRAGAAAGAAATRGASSGNPLAGGASARGSGNPLANRTDPFVGTFANNELRVDVRKTGAAYGGALTINGEQLPFTGSASGSTLNGTFAVGQQKYTFAAQLSGDAMTLSSEGQTYRLTRGASAPTGQASAAPTTQAPMPNGTNGNANAGGMGVAGATGQDAQIAQLLASSAWCSMKYSGGSTYTGGSYGRTSTERVVFGAQGQGVRTTGSENTNSGAPGSAYLGSQGGERFLWKVQGGQLQLSSDGAQWGATPLQIYDNGSGSPIVKANGTEYNLCR